MKKLCAIITLATITSTSFAGEYVEFNDFNSTKAREQVKAELAQSKASGEFDKLHSDYVGFNEFKFTKTREQVKAELAEAKANGEFARLNSEIVN